MHIAIESYRPRHLDAIVDLSLRAWAPVFESLEGALRPGLFRELYPDWREQQANAVREACTAGGSIVRVAVDGETPVGFTVVKLMPESKIGEIYMIAVDPDYQRAGIGAALTEAALETIRSEGMSVAMVETGGDPGHAPARALYERAGFSLLPIARYFKKV